MRQQRGDKGVNSSLTHTTKESTLSNIGNAEQSHKIVALTKALAAEVNDASALTVHKALSELKRDPAVISAFMEINSLIRK
jgi:hypothetical protein